MRSYLSFVDQVLALSSGHLVYTSCINRNTEKKSENYKLYRLVRTVSCNKQSDENEYISKSMIRTNEMIINLFTTFFFNFKG